MSDCKAQKEKEGLVDIRNDLNRVCTLIRGLEDRTTEMMNEAGIPKLIPQDEDISSDKTEPSILVQVEDTVHELEPRLESLTKNLDYLRTRTFGRPTTKTSLG